MSATPKPNQPRPARASRRSLASLIACGLLTCGLLAVAAAQGADTPPEEASALFGSNEWLVVSLETPEGPLELLPGGLAFFKLRNDGALAGTAGCNQMSATFTLGEGHGITFGPVIATRMACPEPVMAQEFAVISALERFTEYQAGNGELVLTGGGYRMVLTTRTPGASTTLTIPLGPDTTANPLALGQSVARYAAAFNDAVAAAAAAGADWPSDPLRVALAFLELKGAPNTIVTRADIGQENATQTVVTVVEDGFLDDSVAGLEQSVTLERTGEVWSVTSYQGAWHCRRPAGVRVALPGVCP